MGESLLLITIVTLVVLTIRRSKPAILDNPVVMHRPGRYHITLATQLNRAQAFIEAIGTRLSDRTEKSADTATRYFCVHDEKVFSAGEKFYLLAVSQRGGMAYFQAIKPKPLKDGESDMGTIAEFSAAVMVHHPLAAGTDAQAGQVVLDAVLEVAEKMHIKVEELAA